MLVSPDGCALNWYSTLTKWYTKTLEQRTENWNSILTNSFYSLEEYFSFNPQL